MSTEPTSHTTPTPIRGIHHVTAIGSDPLTNVEFYTRTLGLRLVKRTVNFDDPGTYHLYYGVGQGTPGSILTFFPWPGARRGTRGAGQATTTSFEVPVGSVDFWKQRLETQGVLREDISTRLGEEILTFLDPDGLKLELVGRGDASTEANTTVGVPQQHAVRGFGGVTLTINDLEASARVLEIMGYRRRQEEGAITRFIADESALGSVVDVVHAPGESFGNVAAGTVHHVAFRVSSDQEQLAWRERLVEAGLMVTDVKDRQYFHSIYFREPGGVLYEIATDPPGFAIDESPETLGTRLQLPPWLETQRDRVEAALPDLDAIREGNPKETP